MRSDQEPDAASRSPVFCLLPWLGLSNDPGGSVRPCCVWSGPPMASLRSSSIEESLNAPALKALRLDMLAGRPSAGCSRCYECERIGLSSFRQWANAFLAEDADAVDRTRSDGSLPLPQPGLLQLSFSNACNFRCRTCGPLSSSAWYPDAGALTGARGSTPSRREVLTPTQDPADFERWLEPYLDRVRIINFVGGEPLLAEAHYRLLERLLARGRQDVPLSYTTNLSVLSYRGWDAPALWNRFEKVHVTASFDATGARAEYLRKGQDWGRAVANWRRVRTECPRATLAVAPAVGIFNVLHLPDFHREWVAAGLCRPEQFDINLVREPRHLSVQALPQTMKERVTRDYRAYVKSYLRTLGPASKAERDPFRGARVFTSVLNFMREADLSEQLDLFRRETRELDRLRGESALEVFPELSELLAG